MIDVWKGPKYASATNFLFYSSQSYSFYEIASYSIKTPLLEDCLIVNNLLCWIVNGDECLFWKLCKKEAGLIIGIIGSN